VGVLNGVLAALCCPNCRRRDGVEPGLVATDAALTCERCGAAYPIVDGIPVFLSEAIVAAEPKHDADETDRQKWQQKNWHDQYGHTEWNIVDPHHAPLKKYCLYRQMGAAAEMMPPALRPRLVLNVCCGSGLEAEYFAGRLHVPVVGTDISMGMVRNAVARASRAGYPFVGIAADSENLPFRSRSVDLAVVLHGLHHLADPPAGLREMARVSSGAILAFEPATSGIREVMMRVGVVSRIEESGNVSYDFSEQSGFDQLLRESGFDRVLYRRELWSLLLSEMKPANVWPLRVIGERMFDLLHVSIGKWWGTKLTVVAWRSTTTP
jgi:SAM-dependent methyltransferase